MTLILTVKLKELPDHSLDMDFEYTPDDTTTAGEIDVASILTAFGTLIDDPGFNEIVEKAMGENQNYDGFAQKGYIS